MTTEEWERVKAENWARPVPQGEPVTVSRPIFAPSGAQVGHVSWLTATPKVAVADIHVPELVEATLYGGPHLPQVDLTVEVRNGVPGYSRVELVSELGQPLILTKHLQLATGLVA